MLEPFTCELMAKRQSELSLQVDYYISLCCDTLLVLHFVKVLLKLLYLYLMISVWFKMMKSYHHSVCHRSTVWRCQLRCTHFSVSCQAHRMILCHETANATVWMRWTIPSGYSHGSLYAVVTQSCVFLGGPLMPRLMWNKTLKLL